MLGKVQDFSFDVKAGVILGEDGRLYLFDLPEWPDQENPPTVGQEVAFTPSVHNAKAITLKSS